MQDRYYLVQEKALPRVLQRTALAKELLKKGEVKTVSQAVQIAGISRAAFYKYRNYVFPFRDASKGKIVTVSLLLEHKQGVLSEVLKIIAQAQASVLTINQGIPLQGVAQVNISFETGNLLVGVEKLLDKLSGTAGVCKMDVVGQNC